MTDSKTPGNTPENLKRYLFSEMTLEEMEKFQEQLFVNDELFQDISDLENDLVDKYVKGKLSGQELNRFKMSLESNPERQKKIANASALQNFIEKSKKPANIIDEKTEEFSFWQKISAFFNKPGFAYAMSAAFILITLFSILLILDNRQKNVELADLQNQDQGNGSIWQEKEKQLREKLGQADKTEDELQKTIDNERSATGELAEELQKERENRDKLQRELEKLRLKQQTQAIEPTRTPLQQTPPRVASIRLSPIGRDKGRINDLSTTRVGDRTSRIAVNLSLPDNTSNEERFSLTLNDKEFLENVAPRISADGKKTISLTIETEKLNDGKNKLSVINKEGKLITDYIFEVNKQ